MPVYEVGIVICSITPLLHYRLVDEQDRQHPRLRTSVQRSLYTARSESGMRSSLLQFQAFIKT